MKKPVALLAATLAAAALAGCKPSGQSSNAPVASTQDDVTPAVRQANANVAQTLNLNDARSLEQARRGFIAAPTGQIKDSDGNVIWDFDAFAFVKGDAPQTVNPSLWRQSVLNNQVGLFKVTDRIWQLRGFDLANITLVEGKSGWIVIDTLTSRETSEAAMAFARKHLGDKPVSAIIFSHSHADHFGGVLGVISPEEAKARNVPIIAPAGFMEEATSENLMAGTAMVRRSLFMYGDELPRNAKGLVDNGLGKAVAYGRVGILPPTQIIDQPVQEVMVDGLKFVFHNVPGSEAPSEYVFEIPELKAFGGAEMMSYTLHNLYTLRGAKVRDALKWADYLDQSLAFTADAEVIFNQHHWPVWGKEAIREFIVMQRDAYKYIHDQTVRMMNAGLTGPEIAEKLQMPKSQQDYLGVHGYYGSVKHNARAVYQFYLGWFDAHPSNLDQLPPVEEAKRYVALAGGVDNMIATAQKAFDAGDFRWSAEVLKHAVYAEPNNAAAKELLARTFDQMGYMAESAPWRNFYLTGATELRNGAPKTGKSLAMMQDMLLQTPIERFLERMAASIDGAKAADSNLKINISFSDLSENYVLWIENAVLHFRKGAPEKNANATLTLTKPFFIKMMTGQAGAKDLLFSSDVKTDGSSIDLGRFLLMIEKAPGTFPIVTR
ncbi:MAG: alkyl sulfatase dimerization domain-containing protein [Beijerinckiaceae bacterium]